MSPSITLELVRQGKAIPRRLGGARGIVPLVMIVGALGWWFPKRQGFAFLDPQLLLIYAASAPLFLVRLAGDAVAEDESEPGMWWPAVLAAAGFGFAVAMTMLAAGLITVNLTSGFGMLLVPATPVLVGLVGISLALAVAVAALAGALALTRFAGGARLVLRLVLVGAIGSGLFVSGGAWREALAEGLTAEGIGRLAGLVAMAAMVVTALAGWWASRRSPRQHAV